MEKKVKWYKNPKIMFWTLTTINLVILGIGVGSLQWFKQKYSGIEALSTDGWASFIGAAIPSIGSLSILWINRLDNEQAQREQEEKRLKDKEEADRKHKELILFQIRKERRDTLYKLSEDISDFYSQVSCYGAKFDKLGMFGEIYPPSAKESDDLIKFSNLVHTRLSILTGTKEMLKVLDDLKETLTSFGKKINKNIKEGNYEINELDRSEFVNNVKKQQNQLKDEFDKFIKEYLENIDLGEEVKYLKSTIDNLEDNN